MTTQIEWHKASELPNADILVLIAVHGIIQGTDGQVWLGYVSYGEDDQGMEGYAWIFADGSHVEYSDGKPNGCTVTHWAHLPEPPKE